MSAPNRKTEDQVMCWDCGQHVDRATATPRKLDDGNVVYECEVCYEKASPANPELFGIGVVDAP